MAEEASEENHRLLRVKLVDCKHVSEKIMWDPIGSEPTLSGRGLLALGPPPGHAGAQRMSSDVFT